MSPFPRTLLTVALTVLLAVPPAHAGLGPLDRAEPPDPCLTQPAAFVPAFFGGGSFFWDLVKWFLLFMQIQMRHDTSRIVKSNHDAANAINRVRTNIYDKETIRDFLPAPLSCLWLDNTELSKAIAQRVKQAVRDEEINVLDRLGQMTRAAQQEMNRAQRHLEEFCAPADQALGLCDTLGVLPNGDLSATIFMNSDQYATADEERAAAAFIDNVANMSALSIPKHLFATPQGRALQARKQNIMALRSLANLVMQESYNDRRATEEGVSGRAQFLKELERRFGSKQWLNKISDNQASPGALQREGLLIRAWQMRLDLLQYEQNERIATLLAALLSDRADDKEERLLQELDAAMRGQQPFEGGE
ncbi:MAG: hypothetical protein V2J55_17785 [Candidatus Competibacteraceae bacterium]|jgi:hypothetical protein|nr:hypothetical protein [Candidatus Competibacteraceae bacterium]